MSKNKKGKRRKKKNTSIVIKKERQPVIRPFFQKYGYHLRNLGIAVLLIAAVLGGITAFNDYFTVKTVVVEGNYHYTDEEIQEMVLGGALGRNSIFLSLKYRDKQIEDVPFVETMDVTIVSADTVKITVYEKTMAGFVEYMGQYFYFDKDGTVVESSNVKTTGIPQIKGLKFDHIVLLEKLPVDDDTIFNHILDISQLLEKYGISAEQIYFDKNYEMTLYFNEARIRLGNSDYIDEKIMKLKMILPSVMDKKGTLRMENYTSETPNVTFELDE